MFACTRLSKNTWQLTRPNYLFTQQIIGLTQQLFIFWLMATMLSEVCSNAARWYARVRVRDCMQCTYVNVGHAP